ncbi:flavin reductase family protein [Mycobacterium novum]
MLSRSSSSRSPSTGGSTQVQESDWPITMEHRSLPPNRPDPLLSRRTGSHMASSTDSRFAPTTEQQADDARQLDPADLRVCLSRFPTGVVVVTYQGPDGPRGITINSFTSVSLDPPLVMVGIARSARTHAYLSDQPFAVNILAADQRSLAECFAGREPEQEVPWSTRRVPSFTSCLAQLICEPWGCFDTGDHTLFIGRVIDVEYGDGSALTFHNSRFGTHPGCVRTHR